MTSNKPKTQRWYLGGMAAMGAVCFTHPLDTLKVHLQTQTANKGLVSVAMSTIRTNGVRGIYSGLSASLMRQGTYTTVRFGVYEVAKGKISPADGSPLPMLSKIGLAAVGGFFGIFAGSPADVINVRMQNDMRLPLDARKNYRNVFRGLYMVVKQEGFMTLYRGIEANILRAMLINIGQVAFYDETKQRILASGHFNDGKPVHFMASFIAGTAATTLTQPVDVLKTRLMQGDKYKNIGECFRGTLKEGGLRAFYKGFLPAWMRLSPQTIITWMFLEQLRVYFPPK